MTRDEVANWLASVTMDAKAPHHEWPVYDQMLREAHRLLTSTADEPGATLMPNFVVGDGSATLTCRRCGGTRFSGTFDINNPKPMTCDGCGLPVNREAEPSRPRCHRWIATGDGVHEQMLSCIYAEGHSDPCAYSVVEPVGGASMKLIHWFAAFWSIALMVLISVIVVAVLGWLAYSLLWKHASAALVIGGAITFIWLGQWSHSYIAEHGWPWKSEAK